MLYFISQYIVLTDSNKKLCEKASPNFFHFSLIWKWQMQQLPKKEKKKRNKKLTCLVLPICVLINLLKCLFFSFSFCPRVNTDCLLHGTSIIPFSSVLLYEITYGLIFKYNHVQKYQLSCVFKLNMYFMRIIIKNYT